MVKTFSWKSSNLWTFVLSFIFTGLVAAGIDFTPDPAGAATDIIVKLSTTGFVGALGLILSNGANIVYHILMRPKDPNAPWWAFFTSWNFLVQAANFVNGILLMVFQGLQIPPDFIAGALELIQSKDYQTLIYFLFTNLLVPLIRYLKDRLTVTKIGVANG